MDVRIRAIDFELTPTISEYAEERLLTISYLLGASEGPARCEVELGRSAGHSKQGNVWFAEINLFPTGGGHFFAREEAESVNAAIDAVKDEILAQVRKSKKTARGVVKKSGAFLKGLLRME